MMSISHQAEGDDVCVGGFHDRVFTSNSVTCNTGVKRFDSNQARQSQPQPLTWRLHSRSLG